MNMKVNIERIIELKAELVEINLMLLCDIDFYKGGKKISIPNDILDKWQYIGLNNTDFITTGYYEGREIDDKSTEMGAEL